MKRINITNGEYLNNFLSNKYKETFIPFNEAMIQGKLLYPLFDDEFMIERSKVHNVKKDEYIDKLRSFISVKNQIDQIDMITLWFGKDAFCIINVVTILAYLEELNYEKEIYINLVDDETCKIIEKEIKIELGIFKKIYINLINRNQLNTNISFIDEGIKDYLYISSNDNFIIDYIRQNNKKSQKELLINLLNMTYNYGLNDTFIISLIDKVNN